MPFCSYDYLLIISLIIPLIIALFSGREERAAACRSVAQPLRNSGKHVRHRNLASSVERTEGARQLERVCGA